MTIRPAAQAVAFAFQQIAWAIEGEEGYDEEFAGLEADHMGGPLRNVALDFLRREFKDVDLTEEVAKVNEFFDNFKM